MLLQVFKRLDEWVQQENRRRNQAGTLPLDRATFRVLGQTALIEAQVDLDIPATLDVDAYTQASQVITNVLDQLLQLSGRSWDKHSGEIWMPEETEYIPFYNGGYVEASLAKLEYVLLSKAIKAPKKNHDLITEYLVKGASDLFLTLAAKYELDLEDF